MAGFNDDERVALRASLGFSELRPEDAFSELARRAQPSGPPAPDEVAAAITTPPEAMQRIEDQLADLAAAITSLTSRVAALEVPAHIGREVEEVAQAQRALALRLIAVEREVCRVTQAGLDRISTRLDALEAGSGGTRRRPLDLLRRQADTD